MHCRCATWGWGGCGVGTGSANIPQASSTCAEPRRPNRDAQALDDKLKRREGDGVVEQLRSKAQELEEHEQLTAEDFAYTPGAALQAALAIKEAQAAQARALQPNARAYATAAGASSAARHYATVAAQRVSTALGSKALPTPATRGTLGTAGSGPFLPAQVQYQQLLASANAARMPAKSAFQRELDEIDQEVTSYVQAYKYQVNLPDAALIVQTAWRAHSVRDFFVR